MTLEIIGIPRSNFVRTVRMVAHEKGVQYTLNPAMPHSDEVKAINPLGLIPLMRHDGLELCESQAIARYIDGAFDGPTLIPADPKAAAPINRWISTVNTSIDQILVRRYIVEYVFHKDDDGNVIRTEIDKAVKRFPRVFGLLNDAVAPGYLGSESFSMADCFLMPILAGARMFPEGKEHLEGSAALAAYFDKVAERPSFIETAP